MGWERRGAARYYYRKRRVNDRVISEYVGGDLPGRLVAALDAEDRRIRAEGRRLALAGRAALAAADGDVARCYDLVASVAAARLEAAGYRRHDRGRWRRRRMTGPAGDLPAIPDDDVHRELALTFGSLTELAESRAIGVQGGDQLPALGRCLMDQLDALRAELGGPAPTALERLLVDRVVLCWFQVQTLEVVTYRKGIDFTNEERLGRYRDRAHNRYLSAIKALAQVRRLQLPALQLNVAMDGGRQVVAGGDILNHPGRS